VLLTIITLPTISFTTQRGWQTLKLSSGLLHFVHSNAVLSVLFLAESSQLCSPESMVTNVKDYTVS